MKKRKSSRKTVKKKNPAKPARKKKAAKAKPKAKKPAKRSKPAPKKRVVKKAAKKKAPAKKAKKKVVKKAARPKKKAPAKKPAVKKAPAPKPQPVPPITAVAPNEQEVGVVTHYYSHLGVAVLRLTQGSLRTGDIIHIKGHTTDFRQVVESIEIEHQRVSMVTPGQSFGLKVMDHAREHDKVYKVMA